MKTIDEITASARATEAKRYAGDAGHFLDRAARQRNTLTKSRETHGTAIIARRASVDASYRIADDAHNALGCVGLAEHCASAACRAAETPLAKSEAHKANQSVCLAARIALEVAERACTTCAEAVKDADIAERAYLAGTQQVWGRLSPDIDHDRPRSTLPTTGLCRLNLE